MDVDAGRLGRGELIAGISAVLLFIVMWFTWFAINGVGLGAFSVNAQAVGAADVGRNAWQSFDIIDLILLLTIIAAVGLAVAAATARTVALPVSASAIVTGLGALS